MKFKIDIIGVVNPVYRVQGFKDDTLEIQYFFNTKKEAKQFIEDYKRQV